MNDDDYDAGVNSKVEDHDTPYTHGDKIYDIWEDLHKYIRNAPLSSGLMAYDNFRIFENFYEQMAESGSKKTIKDIPNENNDSNSKNKNDKQDEWVEK